MNLSIEQRKDRLSTRVKWGIAAAAIILVAPLTWLLVGGLVGLAVAGVLALAIINFAPLVAMKFANWKLAGMKAEARENPIETRQNIALQRHEQLRSVEAGVTAFGTEIRNVSDHEKELRKFGQIEDAEALAKEIGELKADHQEQLDSLEEARTALAAYEQETINLGRSWKASAALLKARGANALDMHKALENLISQEATDAVKSNMNKAFASLETERAVRRGITNRPPQVIDITPVETRERISK